MWHWPGRVVSGRVSSVYVFIKYFKLKSRELTRTYRGAHARERAGPPAPPAPRAPRAGGRRAPAAGGPGRGAPAELQTRARAPTPNPKGTSYFIEAQTSVSLFAFN